MEIKILDLIQRIRTPIGDYVMCFITNLGNAGMIWILFAVVLLLLPRTRKSGAVMIMALILDVILCNGILKNVFARARPCDVNTAVQLLAVSYTHQMCIRDRPLRRSMVICIWRKE